MTLVIVLTCFTTGCDFTQTPTLADACELVFDDFLVGDWTSTPHESDPFASTHKPSRMRVFREGDGYRAEVRDANENVTERRFQLYRIGEQLIAEATVEIGSEGGEWLTLIAIARDSDTLGLRLLSGKWADDHLIANRSMMGCLVRSSAADLIEAIADAGIEAFPGPTNGYIRPTLTAAE